MANNWNAAPPVSSAPKPPDDINPDWQKYLKDLGLGRYGENFKQPPWSNAEGTGNGKPWPDNIADIVKQLQERGWGGINPILLGGGQSQGANGGVRPPPVTRPPQPPGPYANYQSPFERGFSEADRRIMAGMNYNSPQMRQAQSLNFGELQPVWETLPDNWKADIARWHPDYQKAYLEAFAQGNMVGQFQGQPMTGYMAAAKIRDLAYDDITQQKEYQQKLQQYQEQVKAVKQQEEEQKKAEEQEMLVAPLPMNWGNFGY